MLPRLVVLMYGIGHIGIMSPYSQHGHAAYMACIQFWQINVRRLILKALSIQIYTCITVCVAEDLQHGNPVAKVSWGTVSENKSCAGFCFCATKGPGGRCIEICGGMGGGHTGGHQEHT